MHGPDDAPHGGRPDDPPYTVYGGRRRGGRKPTPPGTAAAGDGAAKTDRPRGTPAGAGPASPRGPRAGAPADGTEAPYTVYRAQRRKPDRSAEPEPAGPPGGKRPRRLRVRILRWALTAVVGWIVLSLVLFVVSGTVHQTGGRVDALLGGGGAPFAATNVLVLGTDARPPGSKEPGAEGTDGSTRTDTMMLMRTGAFANAKLSIPRDTIVTIPGHGLQKINAAYAFDGIHGAVQAVQTLTDIDVNHVATMDFQNFPGLIDAMGGIRFTAKSCLTADVSGGAKRPRAGVTIGYDKHQGGTSFRLKQGQTYTLKGSAALALARVRKNRCDAAQDDINRADRQQQILGAMKRRVLSPAGFLRLPWIAWKAPQAVKTDMSGFTLLGVAIGQFLPGGGSQAVLKPSGVQTLPDGEQGLLVNPSDVLKARKTFDQ